MRAAKLLVALAGTSVFLLGPLTAGMVLLGVMAVGATVFVGLYVGRSNWRSTDAGRGLVYTASIVALLGWNGFTYRAFGDYPGRLWLGMIVFYLFVVCIFNMLLTLIRSQNTE